MDNVIRSLFEPTLILDKLVLDDTSYGSSNDWPEQSIKSLEMRGVEYPHIQINETIFTSREISSFEIDCTGYIPRLYLKISLQYTGEFLSTSYPKDGDLVNVYIRGRDNLFKPIRNDYRITDVQTKTSMATNEGAGATIIISGELNVPHLYDELNYAESGTSFEVMQLTAKKLKLGFASNETSTNDSMTWLNAKDDYYNFMQHVSAAAWKDELSFYTFFIDIYYHLNFVNVNKLIKYDADVLIALAESPESTAGNNFGQVSKGLISKCLTNHLAQSKTQFFVKNFKPINNATNILQTYGYAFNATFFEHNSLRAWQLQGKHIVSKDTDKIILRGRINDDSYNTYQKYNYIGIQHSTPEHNTHEHFLYARVHNLMNNLELEKLNVEADINKFNLNLYKYENIPAVFFVTKDMRRIKKLNADITTNTNDNEADEVTKSLAVDKFYTGHYLISGFKIKYSSMVSDHAASNFCQTLILTRREWPSPTGI